MKIVVDENIPLADAFFAPLGEVITLPGRTLSAAQVADADALIVRSVTQVGSELLAGSQVRFVGTCTIGIDHLDTQYLDQQGITWASAPGCNANSVVEYVFASLAALAVDWRGLRFGVVGAGNVGGHLMRRLKALGIDAVAYDPLLTAEPSFALAPLNEVLAADIICLHAPLTTSGPYPTQHLIGARELQSMSKQAVLISAGRGAVVDNQALLRHLENHPQFTAVLDVWAGEPEVSTELLKLVALATPHIAGYSYDGKVRGTEMIYEALCRHLGAEISVNALGVKQTMAQPMLTCPVRTGFPAIADLVRQAYDVRLDDAAMRRVHGEEDRQSRRQGFDLLRKNYPKRREFYNYRLPAGVAEEDKRLLRALGFG